MKVAVNAMKPWTIEDKDCLTQLFMHGFRLPQLCEKMGRTPHSIISQLRQLNLIQEGRDGNYYPSPTEPWLMWQELRDEAQQYKPDPVS